MLKKVHLHNRYIVALALMMSSVCSLMVASPSFAAPGHQDDYQRVQSVVTGASNYYGLNCDTTDISSTWQNYITDPSTWANPGDATNPLSWNYKAKASFETALNSGRWGVSQSVQPGGGGNLKSVIVFWSKDSSLTLNWFGEAAYAASNTNNFGSIAIGCRSIVQGGGGSEPFAWAYNDASSIPISNDIALSSAPSSTALANYFIYTDNPNYPNSYTGQQLNTLIDDDDEDGLIAAREAAQGTSDTQKDSDSDGLNDYVESQWYTNRDDIFCGSSECAYPNPTQKDLYVEVDWMKDGSRTIKPSQAQLIRVADAFSDKGIVAHFDTGQYGGGNELPTYTQDLSFYKTSTATDFYDYKYGNGTITANFDTDRYRIWHYLVSGYQYTQTLGSSGASYVGDDDSFVSVGLIEDDVSGDVDDAIAGTILHELGHSLCLSNTQDYPTQSSSCVYAGVHAKNNPTYSSYESVMNYDYQFADLVDLSSGGGTPEDHDDWSAVAVGLDDFVTSDAEGENPDSQSSRSLTPRMVRRITE